jgi:hypothetical protein
MIRDVVLEKVKDHDPSDIQGAGAQAYIYFLILCDLPFRILVLI